jgi:predicted MPP superfamily phosphohydrolase
MGIFIGFAFLLVLEYYGFVAVKGIAPKRKYARKVVLITYVALTLILWLSFITYRTWGYQALSRELKSALATLFLSTTIAKLVTTVFLLAEDISRAVKWLLTVRQVSQRKQRYNLSRSEFLNKFALAVASLPLGAFIYGALNNAYNYRFRHVPISFPHLPKPFHGFRIVQLSDIHAGSFYRTRPIEEVIEKINSLDADLILFTGDLVNNVADEMLPYKNIFSRLRSKHGVMSVTGNHDYGDYIPWNSLAEKKDNFLRLLQTHRDMGWDILMNEHRVIEREGEKIAVLGVENWGARMRFPKYGKLDAAYRGTEHIPFKILMTHDPSHWDAQVRPQFPDIDLTLSGHTHGFQFGIESKWLKWSPVQWAYKQWAGLYREGMQYLYVNRGFGFIGYPGRVGILPEITAIELRKA